MVCKIHLYVQYVDIPHVLEKYAEVRIHNFIKNHPFFQGVSIPISDLITQGNVKINGVVRVKNDRIKPLKDIVTVYIDKEWKVFTHENTLRKVILMYKPVGYLCTHSDPKDRPIIFDLLPKECKELRCAGRLDFESEGLLVLTNDGLYLHKLTHPDEPCVKKYLVGLPYKLPKEFFDEAESGEFKVKYEDEYGTKILKPCRVYHAGEADMMKYSFLQPEEELQWYFFELSEGKKNQIRKMCEKYTNPVQRLIRVGQGRFSLTEGVYNSKFISLPFENQ